MVTVDIYERNGTQSIHVFVCGYALSKGNATLSIARSLTQKLLHDYFEITLYTDNAPPTTIKEFI